jgi:hypothetical protein
MRKLLMLVVVLALSGAALAGAATTAPATTKLAVSPARGGAHSVFRVHFRPVPSGTLRQPLRYVAKVWKVGGHRAGCVFTRSTTASTAASSVAFATGSSTKAWCAGSFRGTVSVQERSHCGPGPIRAGAVHELYLCPLTRVDATGGPVSSDPGTQTTPAPGTPIAPTPGFVETVRLGTFTFRVQ